MLQRQGTIYGDGEKKKEYLNKFQNMLYEVYNDSNKYTPIFFLITHSVHVHQTLQEF